MLRVVGIAVLVLSLFPSAEFHGGSVSDEGEQNFVSQHASAQPQRSDYWLGWQWSPLFHSYSEASIVKDTTGPSVQYSSQFSNGTTFSFFSWSMATLVLGIVMLWLSKGRPVPTAQDALHVK